MNERHLHIIALSMVPHVGIKIAKTLISYCGGAAAVFKADKKKLLSIPGVGDRIADSILSHTQLIDTAASQMATLRGSGVNITDYLSDDYPTRLRHHDDAPLLLYQKGTANLDAPLTVAIVGTRQPSTYGKHKTAEIIEALGGYKVQILSGLAYGVDTIVHRQCLAHQIVTVAVMGTGIDTVYPPANHQLAQSIIESGALITEFGLGTKADRENFPLRNRIIAALADVTIVIQSASRGGSLITAEYANAYSKDVFALPGRTTDEMSAGCNRLIKTHKAHLLESVDDIAYIMRWDKESSNSGKQQILFSDLTATDEHIVNLLREKEEAPLDWLHLQSKLPLSELAGILLSLEFKGLVASLPGKKYTLLS